MSTVTTGETKYFRRPPVITVMGHVDHGKTSILDAIRHTNVTASEYAGITQHIGAYQIIHKQQKLTFIDTPGHEAFSQMRSRGAKACDIAVLVVAADDGVQPQTREAIKYIKAAQVPIVVAINKIDTAAADPQKVKQQLSMENVIVEDWGGDVVCVEVSAKNKKNIDGLLDALLAVAEIMNLKADPSGELEALIIETRLDRRKGVVVSAIVKNGTLKVGTKVFASGQEAAIRSIMTDAGEMVSFALPSDPVEILGFKTAPNVGDLIVEASSELAQLAEEGHKVEIVGKNTKKTIALVLKADTSSTLEAVKASLANLVTSSVGNTFSIKFLLSAAGDITDSDINLAKTVKGVIIGFDVRLGVAVEELAESLGVRVRVYKTIYELIDEVKDLLEVEALGEEAKIKGRAQILKMFKLPSGDLVAGCKVLAGALKEDSRVAIYEKNPADLKKEDLPLYNGNVKKLKKGKDDVAVVGKDNECGVLLKPPFDGIKEGLWLEVR